MKPFFHNHFARLDRQIVLVDALAALNAGADAVRDLEPALTDVLAASARARTPSSHPFRPRIDRILFAATKADLLHLSHDPVVAGVVEVVRLGRREQGPVDAPATTRESRWSPGRKHPRIRSARSPGRRAAAGPALTAGAHPPSICRSSRAKWSRKNGRTTFAL